MIRSMVNHWFVAMSDYFPFFCQFRETLQNLLDLAREEAWDDFTDRATNYQALLEQLPVIEWKQLSTHQQLELEKLLHELQPMQEELQARTESWHKELASHLHGLHNTGKLERAYRM